jgi:hypothetical protein
MSQDDQTVDNADGASVRADINSNLQALASSSSGASAPTTTWPNQFWFDTTADQLKQRDKANTAWVVVAGLSGTTWTPWFQGAPQGPWSKKAAVVLAKSAGFAIGLGVDGNLFECDVSGGGFTVTLITAASLGDGFLFGIKTTGHATNAVTIDPNGGEQIEGATTRDVSGDGAVEWFRCTGTKFVLGANFDPSGHPITTYNFTDTSNTAGLSTIPTGTLWSLPQEIDIPTSGLFQITMFGRFNNNGGSGRQVYAGLRINGTDYWPQLNDNGTIVQMKLGTPSAGINAGEYKILQGGYDTMGSLDIEGLGISTGVQTVQPIVAATSGNVDLAGATVTARLKVAIFDTL